jgi:hypothetical protein
MNLKKPREFDVKEGALAEPHVGAYILPTPLYRLTSP